MRISRIRCPKCKSKDLVLKEFIVCSGSFKQVNGVIDEEGYNNPGEYFRVDAECSKCGHRWKVKRAIQITDCFIEEELQG